MKTELKEIALQLADWCKKYDKNYVTACFVNGTIMASIDTDDEDYEKCNVFKEVK